LENLFHSGFLIRGRKKTLKLVSLVLLSRRHACWYIEFGASFPPEVICLASVNLPWPSLLYSVRFKAWSTDAVLRPSLSYSVVV
jgi:hypothetical protein